LAWQFAGSLHAALRAGHEDLTVYFLAVQAISSNSPLYEVRAPNGDPFLYPPFAAVIMWPLSWMSERWARGLWTLGTLVLLLVMVVVLAARRPVRDRWEWLVLVPIGAVLLMLSSPARLNLELGQVSALVVTLVLVDALAVPPARFRGVLLGVAVAIKLTPAVFVLYFLVSGRSRDGLRALGSFAACSIAGAIVLPHDSATFWTGALFRMESRLGYLDYVDNQSANAVLLRWHIPAPAITVVWFGIAITVCAAAIVQARVPRPGPGARRAGEPDRRAASGLPLPHLPSARLRRPVVGRRPGWPARGWPPRWCSAV
jgi:alpha-1,2-mannosyltransferase